MSRIIKFNFLFYLMIIFSTICLYFGDFNFIHNLIPIIIIYNIFIDLVFKKLINFFISSSIYQIILSTIFRLFFSILFVFAFILYGVSNEVLFTINFLVVYLLFIIFEITILLLNLHHTK